MRLGIGSYTFGWRAQQGMTPFDLLDEAEQLGVTVVQVADNMPLDALSRDEQARFAVEADGRNLTVEIGTRGSSEDHLRRCLDIADRLSSPLLRVVVDLGSDLPAPKEIVRRLRAVLHEAEDVGVTIAVENHDRFTSETLLSVMEEIGSHCVGICLDTANSIGANEGLGQVSETLAPWVVNLHVKDISIRRLPHGMGFYIEGAPAGRGVLDIPALLERVRREARRDANAIVEVWTPPEDDPAATVAKEARWVRESVSYLRTLIPD